MTKPKPLFKIKINGDAWNIHVFNSEYYQRSIGRGTSAVTMYDHTKGHRDIFFDQSELSKGLVIHEITHAYLSYQYMGSANLKVEQVEEIFCDFLSNKLEELRKSAALVWTRVQRYS